MDSAFKKLIYWSGHTHSLLGLAVHQLYQLWCEVDGNAGVGDRCGVVVSAGHVGGTRGSGIACLLMLACLCLLAYVCSATSNW